jgi:phytoene synthase
MQAESPAERDDLCGDECEALAAGVIDQHSRSFSLAVRFLPSRLRGPVKQLYAWCRTVDDAVDEASSAEEAERRLQSFKTDLSRMQAGLRPHHRESCWIEPLITGEVIEVRHATELIEGMSIDLHQTAVESEHALRHYCYLAAGTVGLMMSRLMGARDPQAARHAVALGIAMQLTNIARDVREDAERGRSYLPGIDDPLNASDREVKAAVRKVLQLAERQYVVALQGLDFLPRNCRPAILLAAVFYREIGREIQRTGYAVKRGRTVVSKPRLAWVAIRSLTQRFLVEPLNRKFSVVRRRSMMGNKNPQQARSVREAKHSVYLGLSLTAIMATALFLLVFVNPKQAAYSYLPLVYAVVSASSAFVFHRLAVRCEHKA